MKFLIILAMLMLATTAMAQVDSVRIVADHDGYMSSYAPSNNYGGTVYALRMGTSSSTALDDRFYHLLIHWAYDDYTGASADIDSAIGWLICSGSAGSTVHDSLFWAHALIVRWAEGSEDGACPATTAADSGATWLKAACADAGGPCGCTGTTPAVSRAWTAAGARGAGTDYYSGDSVSFYENQVAMGVDLTDLVKWQIDNNSNFGFRFRSNNLDPVDPEVSGNQLTLNIASRDAADSEPTMVIYWHTAESAPARGYGRFGRNQKGEYLNDR